MPVGLGNGSTHVDAQEFNFPGHTPMFSGRASLIFLPFTKPDYKTLFHC